MNPFGAPAKCPRCSKTVYAAEQIIGPGRQVYHKICLKCTSCNRRLDSYSLVEHNREPYCKPCHVRGFGTRDLRHQNLGQASPPGSPSSRSEAASPPRSLDKFADRFSKPPAPRIHNEPPLTPPRTVSPSTETAEIEHPDSVTFESSTESETQPNHAESEASAAATADGPETAQFERENLPPAPSPPLSTGSAPSSNPLALPSRALRNTYNFEFRQKSGAASRFPAPLSPTAIKRGSTGFAALQAGPPSPTRRAAFGAESPLSPNATGSTPMRAILSTPTGGVHRSVASTPTGNAMHFNTVSPARIASQVSASNRPTVASSNVFGGRVECPRCAKAVYHAEQVIGPGGRKYHKLCFRCIQCNSSLDASKLTEKDGEPMCRNCYSKTHGPQGAGYALIGRAG
ncbi:Cysteine and glycine-rich protein 3 [Ceratobasidium theobromae]|uniref:Cysteine and glycine-rich protein 3 n=1 Tax=Ceratobasidium theobromae TaxID=1582974 RepID=A0A5N5QQ79_9AGAM|nr:Cysteine and glycine-rich protein 3 [Ceratobasidium theobromae]